MEDHLDIAYIIAEQILGYSLEFHTGLIKKNESDSEEEEWEEEIEDVK